MMGPFRAALRFGVDHGDQEQAMMKTQPLSATTRPANGMRSSITGRYRVQRPAEDFTIASKVPLMRSAAKPGNRCSGLSPRTLWVAA